LVDARRGRGGCTRADAVGTKRAIRGGACIENVSSLDVAQARSVFNFLGSACCSARFRESIKNP